MQSAGRNGFTILEIIIVLLIVGILSSAALIRYYNHIAKMQVSRVMIEVGELRIGVEICLHEGRTTLGELSHECDLGINPSTLIADNGFASISSGKELYLDSSITAVFNDNASSVIRNKTLS